MAVIIGSLLIGVGVNGFFIPHHLLEGGMIGIGLIAKYKWGLEPGLTILLVSIPMYILTFVYKRSFFYKSIHGLILSSLFIDSLHPLSSVFSIPIYLSAVLGGIFIGIGIGIMLRYQTSTGGVDLLALFLSTILPLNVGIIILFFDFSIILTGSLLVIHSSFTYSLLAICTIALFTTICTYSFKKK